jgi:Zn finger protein HypA/HybF involved in hydrogenase expression
MFIKQSVVETSHMRKSKLGIEHHYCRRKTIVHFRCDNCLKEFSRDRGSMNPKRLSNNYFHVCPECDSKKFAQRKGVERKRVWTMNASSDLPISKL